MSRPGPLPALVDQLLVAEPLAVDLAPAVRRRTDREIGSGAGEVLLFSRAVDPELAAVQRVLMSWGVPVVRVDADALAGLRVGHSVGSRAGDSARFPTVSWVRRFTTRAMPGTGRAVDTLMGESWSALVGHLAGRAAVSLPGPRIGLLDQLDEAARAGIRVPRTVITTNPARAAAELTGDRLVLKVLDAHFVEPAPGTVYGVFPQMRTRAELASLPDPGLPVAVQEYVAHDAEYRVYFLDSQLLAFDVVKPEPAAPWSSSDTVVVRETQPPAAVAASAMALAAAWQLTFAAFDFLVADGIPIFLEANLDGDWRWFEARANTRSVSRGVAAMIHNLHVSAGGLVTPRSGFDLLSFLLG